jgi:hypothetical protein
MPSGLTFTYAMNSRSELAGSEGWTTSTNGVVDMKATGTRSRATSNGTLEYRLPTAVMELPDMSNVWPSG